MHKLSLLILTLSVVLLAGCKSEPTSRVYSADMNTTWEAAIRVVRNLTGAEPQEVNRDQGRIATRWTPISSDTQLPDPNTGQVDVFQGVVDLTPTEQGTRVSVRIDQQTRQREEVVTPGASGGSVMVPLKPESGPWQELFLDELASQLGQAQSDRILFCGLNRPCE